MPKNLGDIQRGQPMAIGAIGQKLAASLVERDARYEEFMRVGEKPGVPGYIPPIYFGEDGLFASNKKTISVIGGNKAWKSRVFSCIAVAIYTGIIPPWLDKCWAWADEVRKIGPGGPNERPRLVKIVLGDFAKQWPETIRPFLRSDPERGGIGILPDAWADFDPQEHIFYGPEGRDGSKLSIVAEDPAVRTEPRKLRGPRPDFTWIDEGNRQSVYSESVTRGVAAKDGPDIVGLSLCPQDGFQDWTYEDIYSACYDLTTNKRIPKDSPKRNPAIYCLRVSMHDNPEITPEKIAEVEASIPKHQVAYRVHGMYSQQAVNPYFDYDMINSWFEGGNWSDGVPHVFDIKEVNVERGIFDATLKKIDSDMTLEGEVYDEMHFPVWRVWEKPLDGEKYVLSCDTASGNKHSDYQSADVLKVTDPEKMIQVAQLRMRLLKPGDFSEQCCYMGMHYGKCLLAPEVNNSSGGVFRDRARNYPNWYNVTRGEKQLEKITEKLGWYTDVHAKVRMLETLYNALRQMYMKGHCPIRSRFTFLDMLAFEERAVKDKIGDYVKTEYGARHGQHDDCVISFGIGTRIGWKERHQLSTCKIKREMIKKLPNEHYLGKSNEPKPRAFGGMKQRKSMSQIRRRHGGRNARR